MTCSQIGWPAASIILAVLLILFTLFHRILDAFQAPMSDDERDFNLRQDEMKKMILEIELERARRGLF